MQLWIDGNSCSLKIQILFSWVVHWLYTLQVTGSSVVCGDGDRPGTLHTRVIPCTAPGHLQSTLVSLAYTGQALPGRERTAPGDGWVLTLDTLTLSSSWCSLSNVNDIIILYLQIQLKQQHWAKEQCGRGKVKWCEKLTTELVVTSLEEWQHGRW